MKIFIFEELEQVSCNYHKGGGLVVCAETEERARELANSTPYVDVPAKAAPSIVRDGVEGPEFVVAFPNAGCC